MVRFQACTTASGFLWCWWVTQSFVYRRQIVFPLSYISPMKTHSPCGWSMGNQRGKHCQNAQASPVGWSPVQPETIWLYEMGLTVDVGGDCGFLSRTISSPELFLRYRSEGPERRSLSSFCSCFMWLHALKREMNKRRNRNAPSWGPCQLEVFVHFISEWWGQGGMEQPLL